MTHRLITALAGLTLGLAATHSSIGAGAGDGWSNDASTPVRLGPSDHATLTGHRITPDGATWVTWQDNICLGNVRLQRIDPAGQLLHPDALIIEDDVDLCGNMEMFLSTASDSSVLVHAGGPTTGQPMMRVASDGSMPWGDAGYFVQEWVGGLGQTLAMDNGDVLLVGYAGLSLYVSRVTPEGQATWTTEIPVQTTSNRRIVAALPDGLGGAFIIYDMPLTYTRRIDAVRIDGNGHALWTEATTIVPLDPSSSRHSDPVAVADGDGGVFVFFVEGRESAQTPVPIRMQHLRADGSLEYDFDGVRLSLGTARQFDPDVVRDEASGDLLIAWTDGPIDDRSLRAQRMTPDGILKWGITGVHVASIGAPFESDWDMVWQDDVMTMVISTPSPGEPTVTARRIDGSGQVQPGVVPLSGVDRDARSLQAGPIGSAITVSWFETDQSPSGHVVAQRLNRDDSLGLDAADLNADGVVDVSDLLDLLAQWGDCPKDCSADLDGNGAVDIDDLLTLLAQWG